MEQFFEKFHIDVPITDIGLSSDFKPDIEPKYVGPKLEEGTDIYGISYKKVKHGTGFYLECTDHPLEKYETIEEIEKSYTWPPPDWFDLL
ncbi:MAG: hypothetical protein OH335_04610 [Candidatus Parvarchaeota archaeon]|nr:hypothetical protein [Candidatus Jingweiarchaeum tengchongense]MCW1306027.1 hypothetical protein [Candidatus Jingweiarchaeum tengchongense]